MNGITIKDIAAVTGGRLLCGNENKEIREFSTDSRQGDEDSIFVPLIGERVDGHRFIEGALTLCGATFTQEHDAPLPGCEDKPWIRVEDTLKAMQELGTFYRNKMNLPIVAVTGSVGKTTTREMIACALSAQKHVFQTRGNQNSQVGVPLTLSHLEPDHEIAVLELGMSERGQIEQLTTMIHPNIAVVTMIGISHIAQLGSQDNICAEKMDIVKGLPRDGLVFLNGDDPFLRPYRDRLDQKVFFFGLGPDCHYRAEEIGTNEKGQTQFTLFYQGDGGAVNDQGDGGAVKNGGMEKNCYRDGALNKKLPVTLPTLGEHNVRNALAALAVCHQMGVDLAAAAEKLAAFQGQRQKLIRTNKCILIDDTYNAAPDSMKAAARVLADLEGVKGRRIAGLADMLELGEEEKRYHYETGWFIGGLPIDEVASYGSLSEEMIRGIRDRLAEEDRKEEDRKEIICRHFDSLEALSDYLLCVVRPEDALLLKGSNGMKLARIAAKFRTDSEGDPLSES